MQSALRAVPPSNLQGGLGSVEISPVGWDDVVGLEEGKLHLQRAIEWPFRCPELFKTYGIKPSKGCLLYGPPG